MEIPPMRVLIGDDEIKAVEEILRSGALREGPVCRELEDRFAAACGARFAVSVSSGTAALHVAYAALIEPGDEVIVPAFTFIATASMVVAAGGRPVFCDVDPRTYTIDADDARRRVTPRTRAIAPVHLFGNPADVGAVRAIANTHGLKVVWDAAQAHGARWAGSDVGCLDDAVCYSFYPSKNMTTAEGGMITTNDAELAARMRLIRSHGASGKYHHTLLGFNYRLTDVMAALGLRQLDHLDEWVGARRGNAAALAKHLSGISGITLPLEQPGGESSYNLFTVRANRAGVGRDELVRRLNDGGVGATVHYPRPLNRQPALASWADEMPLPVSERLADEVLSLPVYPGLSSDEIRRIAEALREAVGAA